MSVNVKYKEITADSKNYANRQRRRILNNIGSVWKTITGNLAASDGEYFNDCINKINRDERQIENLLKNQICHYIGNKKIQQHNTKITN